MQTTRVLVQRKDEGESRRRGIPPFGRGFLRHEDLSVRYVFCFSGRRWSRIVLELIIVRDESARLSLGMVASPGTIRRERLDHMIVLNEASLYRHVKSFLGYYHESRTICRLPRTRRHRGLCTRQNAAP